MVCVTISWNSFGLIGTLNGNINGKDYLNIFGDHVYPMVLVLLPDGDDIFQDDNSPIHTDHVVKNWHDEHESELERIDWPTQSLEISILLSICSTSWSDKLETVTLRRRV